MYSNTNTVHTSVQDFLFPPGFHLDENNRWVILSQSIPWDEFEPQYASFFDQKKGAPAKPFRVALGSLIIQHILTITDRETVEQIKENPYLQYFLGFTSYESKAPFDSSLLVHFRQRISPEIIEKINNKVVKKTLEEEPENEENKTEENKTEKKNKGQLILDASCVPSDINYPTDLGLLNKGRVKLEKFIDKLYKPLKGKLEKKPKTERRIARKLYLAVAKKKRVTEKQRRKAIKKQLKYIERNLRYIEELKTKLKSEKILTEKEEKTREIIKELYRQQKWMYDENKRSIENRIVSIEQPYIRPIVRGKAGKAVEFGSKISISYIEGYVFLDYLSWDNFNESQYLEKQVEKYFEYMGYYPESIHVDKIYRTRDNRKYCQEKGIRMSGPKLGKPRKNISKEEKKQAREDEKIRNRVEGKFGEGKRRYGLNLIKTKLKETSENKIAMSFLVMNLMTLVKRVLRALFCLFWQKELKLGSKIIITFDLVIKLIEKLIYKQMMILIVPME